MIVMSEPTPEKIMELYNYMEEKLEEMEMTFEQFTVLYKSFRKEIPLETKKEETQQSPFPWVKYAGYGKYS